MFSAKLTFGAFLVLVAVWGCKNCPDCPANSEPVCSGGGGNGGAAGSVNPDVSTQLTSHRTCDAATPCGTGGTIQPFECTVWDGCSAGHCKMKYASSTFKCVAGAKLACTTNSGVDGVYTCNGSNATPACDWPADGCVKCGGSMDPCCVGSTLCHTGLVCAGGKCQ
jgi:hypothetical protein